MRKSLFRWSLVSYLQFVCTAQQSKGLSPAQISQIKKEVKTAGDGAEETGLVESGGRNSKSHAQFPNMFAV